jgi:hypothetical protein
LITLNIPEYARQSSALALQLNIYWMQQTDRSEQTVSIYQKALGTLPEDGNVVPKQVWTTIHY